MAISVKQAKLALRAAGVPGMALWTLVWPFGRQRRALARVRRRLTVLEAKNSVVDLVFRAQRRLSEAHLHTREQVELALRDPEKRRVILAVGMSREVMEDELRSRYGTEVGRALDRALAELVAEGALVRVPGKVVMSDHDVYLASYRGKKPHYDASRLIEVLTESRGYGAELRSRARKESSTGNSRSYQL